MVNNAVSVVISLAVWLYKPDALPVAGHFSYIGMEEIFYGGKL